MPVWYVSPVGGPDHSLCAGLMCIPRKGDFGAVCCFGEVICRIVFLQDSER